MSGVTTGTALLISAGLGTATALASGAMAKGDKPKVTPTTTMPTTDDAAVKRKRSLDSAALMKKSGKSSTQLSSGSGSGVGGNTALTTPGVSSTL